MVLCNTVCNIVRQLFRNEGNNRVVQDLLEKFASEIKGYHSASAIDA